MELLVFLSLLRKSLAIIGCWVTLELHNVLNYTIFFKFRLSVPENTPFTAVLKFAAEEVCQLVLTTANSHNCLSSQFRVPPATSAIITNGKVLPVWPRIVNIWASTGYRWYRNQSFTDSRVSFLEAWIRIAADSKGQSRVDTLQCHYRLKYLIRLMLITTCFIIIL